MCSKHFCCIVLVCAPFMHHWVCVILIFCWLGEMYGSYICNLVIISCAKFVVIFIPSDLGLMLLFKAPRLSKVAMTFLFWMLMVSDDLIAVIAIRDCPLLKSLSLSLFYVFIICGFFNFISTSLMWLQLNQIQPNPAHPLCRPLVRPLQPNALPPPPQIKRVLYPGQQHPQHPSAHKWQPALPRWVSFTRITEINGTPEAHNHYHQSVFYLFIYFWVKYGNCTQKWSTLLESEQSCCSEKKCRFPVMFLFLNVKAVPKVMTLRDPNLFCCLTHSREKPLLGLVANTWLLLLPVIRFAGQLLHTQALRGLEVFLNEWNHYLETAFCVNPGCFCLILKCVRRAETFKCGNVEENTKLK